MSCLDLACRQKEHDHQSSIKERILKTEITQWTVGSSEKFLC